MQRFLVLYPDGSRGKVNSEQHKSMLRDGVLESIDGRRFRYTGPRFHFRSLADLRILKAVLATTKRLRHYPGIFVWEHADKRRRELLEPPDKLAIRLRELGVVR